ncbi:amidase [Acidithiobacillus thiooxidans]|uniref:Amidase n=1 Tax=Acidithiobacillus sulfurivorans TaxID=1958756 RepID=A0ABS6A2B4_9PROT|nr:MULTISPECIES: amidase [Acidithiobacillus]MBU2761545.1 amidase [Acidithiobacillus sulfurivorans]MBU2837883.1 amidase [Acidithiobacillus thiooxidans]
MNRNASSRILSSLNNAKKYTLESIISSFQKPINNSIKKNAISESLFDYALVLAKKSDKRRANGIYKKLDGVTFTIKDNLMLKNFPSSFGSRVYENHIPLFSSHSVDKLIKLGAIPLAITSCSEFCCVGITKNYKTGDTNHPFDDELTPGGSSGGAATSCALGVGDFALVTDAGGSARRPAALTGLVGYKPSNGLISNPLGFKDPSFLLSTISIISEYVEDSRLVTNYLSGYNKLDFNSIYCKRRVRNITKINAIYSETLGSKYLIDEEIKVIIKKIIDLLSNNNWNISIDENPFGESYEIYPLLALQQAGLAAFYGDVDPKILTDEINEQIDIGKNITGSDLVSLLYKREKIFYNVQSCLSKCDVFICPTIATTAWKKSKLYPETIGGVQAGPRDHAAFTPIFNYVKCPSISLPIGFTDKGLPVGLQFVSQYLDDENLLLIAKIAESIIRPYFIHAPTS